MVQVLLMKKTEGIAFTVWLANYYEIDFSSNLSIKILREAWDGNLSPKEVRDGRINNVGK